MPRNSLDRKFSQQKKQGSRKNPVALFSFLPSCLTLSALFFLIPSPPLPGQEAGSTTAKFSVSQNGGATYNVPIFVSPGTNGMQPKIAITYNSQAGNGLLGRGFDLTGLSVISRVPATLAQDRFLDPVDFDGNDRFALDGQRLVNIYGAYGGNGTRYRTEQETFSRVISYGRSGDGPSFFRVWTKDGIYMEFGGTSDSRIEIPGSTSVLLWRVNRIQDRSGNYMTIRYLEDRGTGESVPYRIDYAGNTIRRSLPYASVLFSYQWRTDPSTHWISGRRILIRRRLTQIRSLYGNTLVRSYTMGYGLRGPNRETRLVSLTERGSRGKSLAPIRFTWGSHGVENFSGARRVLNTFARRVGGWSVKENPRLLADVNGDGKADIVGFAAAGVQVALSTGSGFASPRTWVRSFGWNQGWRSKYHIRRLADVNGDGKADIVGFASNGVYVSFSTGFSFTYPRLVVRYFGYLAGSWRNAENPRLLADVNADGRADIVGFAGHGVVVSLSTGTGFSAPRTWVRSFGYSAGGWRSAAHPRMMADVNGDGRADVIGFASRGVYVSLSTGSSFAAPQLWVRGFGYSAGGWRTNYHPRMMADVNGDGLADVVGFGSQGVQVSLSTGRSFTPPRQWVRGYGSGSGWQIQRHPRYVFDMNGDGRADIIGFSGTGPTVALSTGNNFAAPRLWYRGYGNSLGGWNESLHIRSLGDVDGDGLLDLVAFGDWGTDLARSNLGDDDSHITQIDNNGNKTIITYRPITHSSVYRKGTGSRYPNMDFQAPIYVVYQTRQSTGVNVTDFDLKRYEFEGGVLNLSGRGFRGFRRITVNDYTAGIRKITRYNLDHRFSGASLLSVEQRQIANNRLISATWNGLSLATTFGGRVYRPYVSSSLTRNYELNGGLISSTSSRFIYDAYANLTQATYVFQGGHRKIETYTYANIFGTWILGRLTSKTVTRIRYGKAPITRKEVYRYDSSYVHLLQTTIEPMGGASVRKTVTYSYDAFGNVTVQNTSAWNGRFTETRTARQYYDAKGRFVAFEYNPLGHKQTYFREPLLGLVTTVVGPNGVATYSTYDGFGRKTSTYTPGAGRTTWTYTRWRLGIFSYIVTIRKDGTPVRSLYYDILDRERQQSVQNFNGIFTHRTTEYDRLGRVSRISEPFQSYFWWGYVRKLWTTRHYDLLGRITSVTHPDNSISRTYYSGTTITKIDAKGNRLTEVQDIFGKVLRSYDAYGSLTTYSYDSHNNLISIRDPYGRVTTMAYDLLDRKTRITDPDMGTTYYWFNGFSEQIAERNARGMTTTYRYDRLGRRTHRYEPEGWTYWTYDYGLAGKGKLYRVSGPGGYSETNSYDKYGRLISTLYSGGGRSFRTTNTYDAYGRITQIQYPSGFRVKNIYNRFGYLSEVRNLATNGLFWRVNSKNARGQVLSETFGNGKTTIYSYNSRSGRISRILSSGILDQRFGFDTVGNLTWRTDGILKTSETFGYDRLNRLIRSSVPGFSPVRITYDRTGNILSKSDIGSFRYSSAHPHGVAQILGANGKPIRLLSYDASGNVTRNGTSTLTYTSYNKTRSVSGNGIRLLFDYGPGRDRRLQREYLRGRLTSSRYYAGPLYELQVVGSRVTHFNYILAGGRIVAVHKTGYGAETQYFHRDHLGSIQAITNQVGKVLQVSSYDPWGRRRHGRSWAPGKNIPSIHYRGYTGHEHLRVGELIHMNGRVYDPTIGRFLSADPLVKGRIAGQNLNRYSYVGNNPLSSLDPSGFFLGKLFKKIGKFFKKIWKPLVAIAIGAITGGAALGLLGLSSLTLGGAIVSGIAAGFASSATLTLLNGGTLGDAFKAGLRGAVIGGITGGIMWGIKTGLRMALDRFIPKDAKLYYAEHIGNNVYKITEVDAIKGPRLFVNGILNGWSGDPTTAIQNGFELYGDSFTLLHNPSKGFFLDMLESFAGKVLGPSGEATQLAQWLKNAPGLKEIIAHSQGGIITTNALGLLAREGISLSGVQVTFVGAAVHQGAALGAVKAVNASFGGFYVNPTDAVPNLAGLNGNPINMIRSLLSIGKLTGSGFASPHSATSYSVFFGGPHLGGASFRYLTPTP